MKYRTYYTPNAKSHLDKLEYGLRKRIVAKIRFFRKSTNPLNYAKKLKNSSDLYRFRIGDYRVIFDIDNKGNIVILVILSIKHRKEIYKFT
jgi:mRNA interferase RelE/StbE